ncbi:hypothetical protein N7488_012408 [Penicillium malachiteum]|nr:hypothetical protein N7488_012408 [Penicillium malachiteum]
MDSLSHIIDPDGKVTIVLRNANSPFAQVDENSFALLTFNTFPLLLGNVQSFQAASGRSGFYSSQLESSLVKRSEGNKNPKKKKGKKNKKKKKGKTRKASAEQSLSEEPAAAADEPAATADEPTAEKPPAGEFTKKEATPEEQFDSFLTDSCFRIQVSAKHLILLNGGWRESVAYSQKGKVEITAESWDIEALMIILRAIHGQFNHIPKKLNLEMLAQVAVIADYYECRNVLCLLIDMWIDKVEEITPKPSRNLILWIWIAWFFQLPTQFKRSTSIAMSQSNGSIDSFGLPIPEYVIGEDKSLFLNASKLKAS